MFRPRLADRKRSVARLMRPAMELELSVTLRPRLCPGRLVGGAGGAMMGTVASLMGAAAGALLLCSSSSITISIVPPPGVALTMLLGCLAPGSGAGGGGGGVARCCSSLSTGGGGGGGGGGIWSSRDDFLAWCGIPNISSIPRMPAAASALIFRVTEPLRGALFPACMPIWKPGCAGRPIEPRLWGSSGIGADMHLSMLGRCGGAYTVDGSNVRGPPLSGCLVGEFSADLLDLLGEG